MNSGSQVLNKFKQRFFIFTTLEHTCPINQGFIQFEIIRLLIIRNIAIGNPELAARNLFPNGES
jgi:hypothetical protein